ncbi:MAG: DUF6428 family protein [Bacteroidota bacterium]
MQTHTFLELLEQNADKELLFLYRPDQVVPNSYHITEVKNVYIESVDCGGRPHEERRTVVQLWDGLIRKPGRAMTAGKAHKIFQVVDSSRPLQKETELFIEYGNQEVPTSVYRIVDAKVEEGHLLIDLTVPPTVCKPKLALSSLVEKANACCGGTGRLSCC